jgi:hypothetical protein
MYTILITGYFRSDREQIQVPFAAAMYKHVLRKGIIPAVGRARLSRKCDSVLHKHAVNG